MNKNTKRLIMLNAPYVLIGLLATNLGELALYAAENRKERTLRQEFAAVVFDLESLRTGQNRSNSNYVVADVLSGLFFCLHLYDFASVCPQGTKNEAMGSVYRKVSVTFGF